MHLRSSNAYELTGNPASSHGSAFADDPEFVPASRGGTGLMVLVPHVFPDAVTGRGDDGCAACFQKVRPACGFPPVVRQSQAARPNHEVPFTTMAHLKSQGKAARTAAAVRPCPLLSSVSILLPHSFRFLISFSPVMREKSE